MLRSSYTERDELSSNLWVVDGEAEEEGKVGGWLGG